MKDSMVKFLKDLKISIKFNCEIMGQKVVSRLLDV